MPEAHYVHPEFGLLCPTPRLRRKLRLGLACLIFALIGGAVLRASNLPPNTNSSSANSSSANSPSANSSSAITAAHRDEGAATSADAGRLPAATLATRPSLPAIAETGPVKNDCAHDSALHRTWAYLDGKCAGSIARKPRTVRVETDRPPIAAIAIGRIAAPDRVAEPASSAPSVPTGPLANPPKSAAAAPAAIAASTEPSPRPAASKKPQKNRAQPSAPARANRNRCRLVARGARRGWRRARLWRARLWPWRIRARRRLRLEVWSAGL